MNQAARISSNFSSIHFATMNSKGILRSLLAAGLCLTSLSACSSDDETTTIFELRIENVSSVGAITTSNGESFPALFSSAVGAAHLLPAPIYSLNASARANGLEQLAEDANPQNLGTALQSEPGVTIAFLGTLPIEENSSSGVLAPGQSYRILFNVEDSSARLSLALGFILSNDLFVASPEGGIALFEADGTPRTADITSEFALLDAGTEVNQAPGAGPDQAFRQTQPNQGASENGLVRAVNDGFSYPSVANSLRISISPLQVLE